MLKTADRIAILVGAVLLSFACRRSRGTRSATRSLPISPGSR